jgi:molybdate transport system substrate-binding protein
MNLFIKMQPCLLLFLPLLLCCCDATRHPLKDSVQKKEMLIYCGTTMLQPILELSAIVEKEKNCVVKVSFGGSEHLSKSVEVNKIGELFFPGSVSYIQELKRKGFITETVDVGSNEVALFVRKGNPKEVKADLTDLMRPDLEVVIGARNAGSIGKATQMCLSRKGIYEKVLQKAAFLTTDSKGLVQALRRAKADVALIWLAVGYVAENKEHIEVIRLPDEQVLQQKLTIGLLSFSQNPELGKYFLELAASSRGKEIFSRYGL